MGQRVEQIHKGLIDVVANGKFEWTHFILVIWINNELPPVLAPPHLGL